MQQIYGHNTNVCVGFYVISGFGFGALILKSYCDFLSVTLLYYIYTLPSKLLFLFHKTHKITLKSQ